MTVDNRNCLFQAVMTHGTMAVRMQPCPCKRCPSNVGRGPASDVSWETWLRFHGQSLASGAGIEPGSSACWTSVLPTILLLPIINTVADIIVTCVVCIVPVYEGRACRYNPFCGGRESSSIRAWLDSPAEASCQRVFFRRSRLVTQRFGATTTMGDSPQQGLAASVSTLWTMCWLWRQCWRGSLVELKLRNVARSSRATARGFAVLVWFAEANWTVLDALLWAIALPG